MIATVHAGPGAHVRIPVVANTERELQGFTVVASFDPAELTIDGLDLEGSFTETLDPDFVSPTIKQEDGFFFIGVAFDLLFEGEPKVIPPGKDYVLFFIEVEVKMDVTGGHASILLTETGSAILRSTTCSPPPDSRSSRSSCPVACRSWTPAR